LDQKPQILYLFDPLCGWCYGFSENINNFSGKHQDKFEVVPIPGGMVVEERVRPISSMAGYIGDALKKVEQTTGCTFGEAYKKELRDGDMLLDSEPPSRALITFRTFDLNRSILFAKSLQSAHYMEGKDYNDPALYRAMASSFGLDPDLFMERFNDPEMKQQVQQEFAWVRESGIQGYPTVVLRNKERYYLLTNGYASLDTLEQSLQKAMKMILN
jgi:putative protein-disulfide isomerase